MNKSNELSNQLQALESKAADLFSELLKKCKSFNFLQQVNETEKENPSDEEIKNYLKDEGELYLLPTLGVYNDITGNMFNVHVCKIDETGIHTIKEEDETDYQIKFSDLIDLDNRLVLLNEMEELFNK